MEDISAVSRRAWGWHEPLGHFCAQGCGNEVRDPACTHRYCKKEASLPLLVCGKRSLISMCDQKGPGTHCLEKRGFCISILNSLQNFLEGASSLDICCGRAAEHVRDKQNKQP
uniref:Uncharacterized protein n=1 Tax=Taeniopygia guttata TaxID=59729 RepID=A0A674GEB1_TAEGU